MKLSMIVLITSCEPNFALNIPGIAPQTPPATTAVTTHSVISNIDGRLNHDQFSSLPKMFTIVPPNLIPTQAVANAATLALTGCGYNELQRQDEGIKAAWSEVLNQYQRHADLVPNLVNTVKGYAAQEQTVLTEVTNARANVGAIGGKN